MTSPSSRLVLSGRSTSQPLAGGQQWTAIYLLCSGHKFVIHGKLHGKLRDNHDDGQRMIFIDHNGRNASAVADWLVSQTGLAGPATAGMCNCTHQPVVVAFFILRFIIIANPQLQPPTTAGWLLVDEIWWRSSSLTRHQNCVAQKCNYNAVVILRRRHTCPITLVAGNETSELPAWPIRNTMIMQQPSVF